MIEYLAYDTTRQAGPGGARKTQGVCLLQDAVNTVAVNYSTTLAYMSNPANRDVQVYKKGRVKFQAEGEDVSCAHNAGCFLTRGKFFFKKIPHPASCAQVISGVDRQRASSFLTCRKCIAS